VANTYSQVFLQVVFAVKFRQNLILPEWKGDLHKYLSGIIRAKGHKAIIVNGVENHIHAFIGLKPGMAISDLVRDIKNNSANFVNDNKWVSGRFSWQEGFGVFSYSQSHVEMVYMYILNQEEHHRKITFKEEYINLLKEFQIDYDEKYLFDWLE
jgi:REP element-mobilizing transposase RayT